MAEKQGWHDTSSSATTLFFLAIIVFLIVYNTTILLNKVICMKNILFMIKDLFMGHVSTARLALIVL